MNQELEYELGGNKKADQESAFLLLRILNLTINLQVLALLRRFLHGDFVHGRWWCR